MANKTIYPYGYAGQAPSGVLTKKVVEIEDTIYQLADWAFRDTPNNLNSVFRGVLFFPSSDNGVCGLRYGTQASASEYFLSPIFDISGRETYDLTFNTGEVVSGSNRFPGLVFFNANYEFTSYYSATATPRTVSGSTETHKYVRMTFPASKLLDAYLIDNNTGETLFVGRGLNTNAIKPREAFLESAYIPTAWKPNSRGDFIGWNFGSSDSAATAQRTEANYPYLRRVGINATALSFSISKLVKLPASSTINVEFSCGEVDSGLMLRLLNFDTDTANYYTANENPRTVSVNSATYPYVQLYFHTENYEDCYIKDATNDEILWQGASSTD